MPQTDYGDISPRTAAFAQKELLERGLPYLLLEKFGDGKPVPTRSTKATKFRRYEALSTAVSALTEGVTPAAEQLTFTDITATLVQYGNRVQVSDVILDTHEDPVLQETVGLLGEQAAAVICAAVAGPSWARPPSTPSCRRWDSSTITSKGASCATRSRISEQGSPEFRASSRSATDFETFRLVWLKAGEP